MRAVGAFVPANDGWAFAAATPGLCDPEVAAEREGSPGGAARRLPALVARGGARLCVALAAVALGGPAAMAATRAPTRATPEIRRGDRGPQVRAVQRALHVRPDGVFGPRTARAVRAFQRRHGLPVTGRVDARTRAALRLRSSGAAAGGGEVKLTRGEVPALQSRLGVDADGVIGPQTRSALRAFERAHGLTADGRVDLEVLQALGLTAERDDPGATAPAAATGAQAAVQAAVSKVGSPYSSGATGPDAFDCSGLVTWAMRSAGIAVPRTSYAQFGIGSAVARSRIQAGDLVFLDTSGSGASDVGLATGPTTAVSATTTA